MRYLHAVSLCGSLALCAVGCSGNPSAMTLDGGAGPDASTAQNVTGTSITTYVLDTSTTTKPSDLSQVTIAALVPISTGGFTTITGQGKADGTFSIPNVPMGTYYLQLSDGFVTNSYTVTSARVLDLGRLVLGRSDITATTQTTTTFSPALTGLRPGDSTTISSCSHRTPTCTRMTSRIRAVPSGRWRGRRPSMAPGWSIRITFSRRTFWPAAKETRPICTSCQPRRPQALSRIPRSPRACCSRP